MANQDRVDRRHDVGFYALPDVAEAALVSLAMEVTASDRQRGTVRAATPWDSPDV